MKAKTIAKTIKAKVDDWLASIDDGVVRAAAARDVIVTGGCIPSMFLQEKVNDYDLYFKHQRTVFLLASYYVNKAIEAGMFNVQPIIRLTKGPGHHRYVTVTPDINPDNYGLEADIDHASDISDQYLSEIARTEIYIKSQGFAAEGTEDEQYEYFETRPDEEGEAFIESSQAAANRDKPENAKYRPVFMSSNAVTLSDKVQLVLRFTGDPEEIHESYDFVHATNYWTYKTGLVTNTKALEAILARELVYRGSLYPLASIFRTRKFIQRGWSCHVGNYLKMALQLNDFDLNDPEVLHEQLTGVDAAYLHDVLRRVREQKQNEPDFQFNSAYLCTLVERMMGENDE